MSKIQTFLIGTATAAHHIESELDNDWSNWLQHHAQRLANSPLFSAHPSFLSENYKSKKKLKSNYLLGNVIDHQRDYTVDFDMMRQLGCTAYRFSLEWSRIEPERGQYSSESIAYYQKYIRELKKRNIEPIVTLWHFTLPNWVSHHGGWENPRTIDDYLSFVKKIVTLFSGEVTYWITVNEPEVYATECYLVGKKLSMKRNVFAHLKVLNALLTAHRKAYQCIKEIDPTARVSIAKHFTYFSLDPSTKSLLFSCIRLLANYIQNHRILRTVAPYCDFLGINHYITITIGVPENYARAHVLAPWMYIDYSNQSSDLGWSIFPEHIYDVILELKRYGKPILITENGIATEDEALQTSFLKTTFTALEKARKHGANVIGYLYFTLFDCFEWTDGFAAKFGLIKLNFETRKRQKKKAARIFKTYARSHTPIE